MRTAMHALSNDITQLQAGRLGSTVMRAILPCRTCSAYITRMHCANASLRTLQRHAECYIIMPHYCGAHIERMQYAVASL